MVPSVDLANLADLADLANLADPLFGSTFSKVRFWRALLPSTPVQLLEESPPSSTGAVIHYSQRELQQDNEKICQNFFPRGIESPNNYMHFCYP
jgi:hypothetical protein